MQRDCTKERFPVIHDKASQPDPDAMTDYDDILISIRRIMRAIDLQSKRLVKQSGLTAPQLVVMQSLRKAGKASPTLWQRTWRSVRQPSPQFSIGLKRRNSSVGSVAKPTNASSTPA